MWSFKDIGISILASALLWGVIFCILHYVLNTSLRTCGIIIGIGMFFSVLGVFTHKKHREKKGCSCYDVKYFDESKMDRGMCDGDKPSSKMEQLMNHNLSVNEDCKDDAFEKYTTLYGFCNDTIPAEESIPINPFTTLKLGIMFTASLINQFISSAKENVEYVGEISGEYRDQAKGFVEDVNLTAREAKESFEKNAVGFLFPEDKPDFQDMSEVVDELKMSDEDDMPMLEESYDQQFDKDDSINLEEFGLGEQKSVSRSDENESIQNGLFDLDIVSSETREDSEEKYMYSEDFDIVEQKKINKL